MRETPITGTHASLASRLQAAIEAGDAEGSLRLLRTLLAQRQAFVDSYVRWIDLLLCEIAARLGEPAIYEVIKRLPDHADDAGLGSSITDLDVESTVRLRAQLWTEVHLQDCTVEEDDEKFVVSALCNTGGALLGRKHGSMIDAYSWTGGRISLPYYCTHCPINFEVVFAERHGHPIWVYLPPKAPGERCVQHIYKNRDANTGSSR